MELAEPINFNDLLTKSIIFKIDQEQAIERCDGELLEDDDETTVERKQTSSPWLQSFDELRKSMEPIANQRDLYKQIIRTGSGDTLEKSCTMRCRIHWSYSMFMELEEFSFDSTHTVRKTECDELMPGLWLALRTMRKGEESQFLIGYRLMFREMGSMCGAYRIKPKADILLVAKLVDFEEIGTENACEKLTDDELHHYPTVKRRAIEMQMKMLDFYTQRAYVNAIKIGLDIIERVTFCDISTDAESQDRKEFLTNIYVKLIDCYIKVEKYKKSLDMIGKLRRVTKVEQFVDVLVNEAIALSKTADNYQEPIDLLRKAQRLYPHNELVHEILNNLQAEHRKYKTAEKTFMMKAFNVKTPPSATASVSQNNDVKTKSTTPLGDPKLTEIIRSFNDIDIGDGIPLIGYTPDELKMVKEAIKQTPNYQLKMKKNHDDQTNYTIVKAE